MFIIHLNELQAHSLGEQGMEAHTHSSFTVLLARLWWRRDAGKISHLTCPGGALCAQAAMQFSTRYVSISSQNISSALCYCIRHFLFVRHSNILYFTWLLRVGVALQFSIHSTATAPVLGFGALFFLFCHSSPWSLKVCICHLVEYTCSAPHVAVYIIVTVGNLCRSLVFSEMFQHR